MTIANVAGNLLTADRLVGSSIVDGVGTEKEILPLLADPLTWYMVSSLMIFTSSDVCNVRVQDQEGVSPNVNSALQIVRMGPSLGTLGMGPWKLRQGSGLYMSGYNTPNDSAADVLIGWEVRYRILTANPRDLG
jgi:hypothetical protein